MIFLNPLPHHAIQNRAGSTPYLSLLFHRSRNEFTPDLRFERIRKSKKYFLDSDGRSDKKYCPEGLAGMYKGILYLSQSNGNIVLINPELYIGIIPLILISFSQFTLANHPYQMFNKCLEALPALPHTQVHHTLS